MTEESPEAVPDSLQWNAFVAEGYVVETNSRNSPVQARDTPVGPATESSTCSSKLSGVATVPISSLRPSDSPRRAGENPEHIRALAESDAHLPPIVVMPSTMRVIDGMHRLRAAELRGATEIEVQYFEGEEKDAFVLAVESNVTHGLPLTRDDRKAAAARILSSHPLWSDRAIGSATGLSAKTVCAIRSRSTEALPQSNVRIGRDGRARPLDPTEGRMLAGRLIQENPSAPLRQIAAQAGVSLSTVSDVRKRLQRGEGPVPERVRVRKETGNGTEEAPQQRRPDEAEANRPSRTLMLRHLSRDPSVRLTEDGRALLRWLNVVAVRGQDWERLLGNIPPHRVDVIAELARGCAEIWQQVAEQLERTGGAEADGAAGRRSADALGQASVVVGAGLGGGTGIEAGIRARAAHAMSAARPEEVAVPVTDPPERAASGPSEPCCAVIARRQLRTTRR
ncbi:ParB/RepB/Spo0J family partition protein [Streptomyces sp. C36]|uniref:ParB/RepB/Spo0J family partition protein n=1 Tax=Streptomyces sp. C36 TaxID=3237122 RepID=UPI0034C61110